MVAFFSRKEDKIEAAKAEIDAAGPGKVFGREMFDMASGDRSHIRAWLENGRQGELGGCDIFSVHTASASGNRRGGGDWQACLDMDLKGAAFGEGGRDVDALSREDVG